MAKLFLENRGKCVHQFGAKSKQKDGQPNHADPYVIKPGQKIEISNAVAPYAQHLMKHFPKDFAIQDERQQEELDAQIAQLDAQAKAAVAKVAAEAKEQLDAKVIGKAARAEAKAEAEAKAK